MAKKRQKKARKKVAVPEGGWQQNKGHKTTPKINPVSSKTIPSLDIDSEEIKDRRLVWRLGFHDDTSEWSLNDATREQMINLLDKLRSFETMTIKEIFHSGIEHGKSYEVDSLPDHAKRRLRKIGRDDEDQLHRLRCSGPARLFGIMREHVFHILWWDPEHKIWPSKKRNT